MYRMTDSFLIRGELADSYRKAHTGGDIIYEPKWDSAYRIGMEVAKEKYSSTVEYSRAGPYFETTGGFAAQDLESLQAAGDLFITNNFTVSPYVTLNRDNLKDLKSAVSKQINPGVNMSLALPREIILTCGWDFRKEYSSDKTSSNSTSTWSAGMMKSFKYVSAQLDYLNTQVRDHVSPDQERNKHAISTNFNGNFTLRKTIVSWNLGQTYNIDKDRTTSERDLLFAYFGGVSLSFPNDLNIRANLYISDNDFYTNANDSNVNQYNFSITKNIKDRLSAALEYTQKDNEFAGENDDYFEKIFLAKLSCKF